MYMGYHNRLNQEFDENLLEITHIQAEEVIYVHNQHQYMEQLINLISIIHNR